MLLCFKDYVVATTVGQDVVPVTQMLLSGDYSSLTSEGFSLTEDSTPVGIKLVPTGNSFDITTAAELYDKQLLVETDAEAEQIEETILALATNLQVDGEQFLELLAGAQTILSVITTDAEIPKRAEMPSSIKLKAWVSAINSTKGFTANAVETVTMDTPESEIIMKIDSAKNIINGLPNSAQINALFSHDESHKTILWRKLGVQEEDLLGTGETDSIDVLPNEQRLYEQLNQLLMDLAAVEENNPINGDGTWKYIPETFTSYMESLIYRALSANWKHTGLIHTIAEEEEEDDDDDDDDDDNTNADGKVEKPVSVNNQAISLTAEEMDVLKASLVAKRLPVAFIRSALDMIKDFIQACIAQEVDPKVYIICFIKLLRWGNRRPRLLKLTLPNRSLETELFTSVDDFANFEKKVRELEGKTLLPVGYVYGWCKLSPGTKLQYGLTDMPKDLITGIMCKRFYDVLGSGGKTTSELVYVDALNMIDEEFHSDIIGINFDKDTNSFKIVDNGTKDILENSQGNAYTIEPIVEGKEKQAEYTLPNCMIDIVSPLNVNNKKRVGLSYLMYLLNIVEDGTLTQDEISLLTSCMPLLKQLKAREGDTYAHFIDMANLFSNEQPTKLISLTPSSVFQSEPVVEKPVYSLMSAKVVLEKAFYIRDNTGKIVGYLATKPFGLYLPNTTVLEAVNHPKLPNVESVIAYVESSMGKIKAQVTDENYLQTLESALNYLREV